MNIPTIFLDMANRSITAGIVILAVLLARELLRRAGVPRRYIYLLWLIPALRLLCPLSVSSAVSLFNLPVFDRAAQTEAGLAYLPRELPELATQEGRTADIPEGFYGMSQVRQDVGQPANYYGGQVFDLTEREESPAGNRVPDGERDRPAVLQAPGKTTLWLLTGVWIAGVLAVLARQIYAYAKIRRKTACAARLPGGDGDVYECEGICTPFAMGLLRTKIYIPYRMPEKEREYVLMHERCHIRCRDLWTRALACVLLAVYWYNPLVWLGVCCMERDMEMRCDEYVLRQMGEDIRYDYSLSLLSYAAGRARQPMGITAFGESGTGKRVKHVLRYRRTGICIALLALAVIGLISVVCLTDRSTREEPVEENNGTTVNGEEKTYFWGQQEMRLELSEDTSNPAMYLVGRSILPLPQEAEAGEYGESMDCVGEHCYFLARPLYMEDSTVYELHVFDGDKKEWSSGLVDRKRLGRGALYDLFAVSDQELVYLVLIRDGWRYEHYYAVHVSREGEELKRVDLLPVCQDLGMIVEQVLPTNICVDKEGNYYMVSLDGKQMAILDGDGKLLENRDCSVKYKRIIPWMTPGPDGGILTQSYHETNGMEWTWLDGNREKSLGAVRNADFNDRLIPLDNGLCYYITAGKKVFQGDADTGAAEFLYDAGAIIGNWGDVLVNGDGEVILLALKTDQAVAYVLSRERETPMGAGGESITVADPLRVFTYGGYENSKMPIEKTLPLFMAEHPEYAFDLQVMPWRTYYAEGHDRLWNELIAGEGPDILYVDNEDLSALWEKGVLLDLRELVSQETLDMIYPGMLDTGIIDGSLAGVSTGYSVCSMVTSRDIWPEEQWTLEDVVTLLEAGDRPHGISDSGYRWIGGNVLMYRLSCYDMAHSPFIDWENGTCSFDSELFVRLLKVAKQYEDDVEDVEGYEEYYTMAGYRQLLENGCVAVEDSVCGLDSYVRIRQCMGESYNRIGLPGDVGSNQAVTAAGYFVVNKNCGNREAAAAYLEFVLSRDSIVNYRRDARDFFKVGRDWEGKWAVIDGDIEGTYLGYLLDRNDPALFDEEMPEVYVKYLEYAEEYYRFMESLEGEPPSDGQIENIISEEADNYFYNGQSAEHVAQVIQSRVQMYLSERQ